MLPSTTTAFHHLSRSLAELTAASIHAQWLNGILGWSLPSTPQKAVGTTLGSAITRTQTITGTKGWVKSRTTLCLPSSERWVQVREYANTNILTLSSLHTQLDNCLNKFTDLERTKRRLLWRNEGKTIFDRRLLRRRHFQKSRSQDHQRTQHGCSSLSDVLLTPRCKFLKNT